MNTSEKRSRKEENLKTKRSTSGTSTSTMAQVEVETEFRRGWEVAQVTPKRKWSIVETLFPKLPPITLECVNTRGEKQLMTTTYKGSGLKRRMRRVAVLQDVVREGTYTGLLADNVREYEKPQKSNFMFFPPDYLGPVLQKPPEFHWTGHVPNVVIFHGSIKEPYISESLMMFPCPSKKKERIHVTYQPLPAFDQAVKKNNLQESIMKTLENSLKAYLSDKQCKLWLTSLPVLVTLLLTNLANLVSVIMLALKTADSRFLKSTAISTSLLSFVYSIASLVANSQEPIPFNTAMAARAVEQVVIDTMRPNSDNYLPWVKRGAGLLIALFITGALSKGYMEVSSVVMTGNLLRAGKEIITDFNLLAAEASAMIGEIEGHTLDVTAITLQTTVERINKFMSTPMLAFLKDRPSFEEFKTLHERLPKILLDAENNAKGKYQSLKMALTSQINSVNTRILEIQQVFKLRAKMDPFVPIFYGERNVGKTRLLQYLTQRLHEMGILSSVGIYDLKLNGKHYNTYDGCTMAQKDEFYYYGDKDDILPIFTQLCSSAPLNLAAASIPEKKQWVNFHAVMLATNVPPELVTLREVASAECKRAFFSRTSWFEIFDPNRVERGQPAPHRRADFTHLQITVAELMQNDANAGFRFARPRHQRRRLSIEEFVELFKRKILKVEIDWLDHLLAYPADMSEALIKEFQERRAFLTNMYDPPAQPNTWEGKRFFVPRFQGPTGVGKTEMVKKLVHKMAAVSHLPVKVLGQDNYVGTYSFDEDALKPSIFVIDDLLVSRPTSNYAAFVSWMNRQPTASIFILITNKVVKRIWTPLTKLAFKCVESTTITKPIGGLLPHTDPWDMREVADEQDAIVRRIGLSGVVKTRNSTHFVDSMDGVVYTLTRAPQIRINESSEYTDEDHLLDDVMGRYKNYLAATEQLIELNEAPPPGVSYDMKITAPNLELLKEMVGSAMNLNTAYFRGYKNCTISVSPSFIAKVAGKTRAGDWMLNGDLSQVDLAPLVRRLAGNIHRLIPGVKFLVKAGDDLTVGIVDGMLYFTREHSELVVVPTMVAETKVYNISMAGLDYTLDLPHLAQVLSTYPHRAELPASVVYALQQWYLENKGTPEYADLDVRVKFYTDTLETPGIVHKYLACLHAQPVFTILVSVLFVLMSCWLVFEVMKGFLSLFGKNKQTAQNVQPPVDTRKPLKPPPLNYEQFHFAQQALTKNKFGSFADYQKWLDAVRAVEKADDCGHEEYHSMMKTVGANPYGDSAFKFTQKAWTSMPQYDQGQYYDPLGTSMPSYPNTLRTVPPISTTEPGFLILAKTIQRNAVQLNKQEGLITNKSHGLGLYGHTILTVSHLFGKLGETAHLVSDEGEAEVVCYSIDRERDLAKCRVIPDKNGKITLPAFKDITHHFSEAASLPFFDTGLFVRFGSQLEVYPGQFSYHERLFRPAGPDGDPTYVPQTRIIKFKAVDFHSEHAYVRQGDCGLPLIAFNGKRWVVLAIHNGVEPSKSVFSYFTSEDTTAFKTDQGVMKNSEYTSDFEPIKIPASDNIGLIHKNLLKDITTCSPTGCRAPNTKVFGYNKKYYEPMKKKQKGVKILAPDCHFPVQSDFAAMTVSEVKDTSNLYFDPLRKEHKILWSQTQHYGTNVPTISQEQVDRVHELLKGLYQHWYGTIKILTETQSLNGLPYSTQVDRARLNPLDMTTSSGLTYAKDFDAPLKGDLFQNISKGLEPYYTYADTAGGQHLKGMVAETFEQGLKGIPVIHAGKACKKVEVLPQKKVDIGKTRMFVCPDVERVIHQRRLYGDFFRKSVAARHRAPSQIGFNPYREMTPLFFRCYEPGFTSIDTDVKRLDKNVWKFLRMSFASVISSLVEEGTYTREQVENLFLSEADSACHLVLSAEGVLFMVLLSVHSGEFITTSLDNYAVQFGWINSLLIKTAAVMPDLEVDVPFVNKVTSIIDFGDDNIMKFLASLDMSFDDISRGCLAIGFEVVPADKDDEGLVNSFCSRQFTYDEKDKIVYPGLKKRAIIQMIHFFSRIEQKEIASNFKTALFEAALWEEEFFVNIQSDIKKVISQLPTQYRQDLLMSTQHLRYRDVRKKWFKYIRLGEDFPEFLSPEDTGSNLIKNSHMNPFEEYRRTTFEYDLTLYLLNNLPEALQSDVIHRLTKAKLLLAASSLKTDMDVKILEMFVKTFEEKNRKDSACLPEDCDILLSELKNRWMNLKNATEKEFLDEVEREFERYGKSGSFVEFVLAMTKAEQMEAQTVSQKLGLFEPKKKKTLTFDSIAKKNMETEQCPGNYVGAVQEWCVKNKEAFPDTTFKKMGFDHDPTWQCTVIGTLTELGRYEFSAQAKEKKDSKQRAYEKLWLHLPMSADNPGSVEEKSIAQYMTGPQVEVHLPKPMTTRDQCAAYGQSMAMQGMMDPELTPMNKRERKALIDRAELCRSKHQATRNVKRLILDQSQYIRSTQCCKLLGDSETMIMTITNYTPVDLSTFTTDEMIPGWRKLDGHLEWCPPEEDNMYEARMARMLKHLALGTAKKNMESSTQQQPQSQVIPAAPSAVNNPGGQAASALPQGVPTIGAMSAIDRPQDPSVFASSDLSAVTQNAMFDGIPDFSSINMMTRSFPEMCTMHLDCGTPIVISGSEVPGTIVAVIPYWMNSIYMNPYAREYIKLHKRFAGPVSIEIEIQGVPLLMGSLKFGIVRNCPPPGQTTINLATLEKIGWKNMTVTGTQSHAFIITDAREDRFFRNVDDEFLSNFDVTKRPGIVVAIQHRIENQFADSTTEISIRVRSALAPNFLLFEPRDVEELSVGNAGGFLENRTLADLVFSTAYSSEYASTVNLVTDGTSFVSTGHIYTPPNMIRPIDQPYFRKVDPENSTDVLQQFIVGQQAVSDGALLTLSLYSPDSNSLRENMTFNGKRIVYEHELASGTLPIFPIRVQDAAGTTSPVTNSTKTRTVITPYGYLTGRWFHFPDIIGNRYPISHVGVLDPPTPERPFTGPITEVGETTAVPAGYLLVQITTGANPPTTPANNVYQTIVTDAGIACALSVQGKIFGTPYFSFFLVDPITRNKVASIVYDVANLACYLNPGSIDKQHYQWVNKANTLRIVEVTPLYTANIDTTNITTWNARFPSTQEEKMRNEVSQLYDAMARRFGSEFLLRDKEQIDMSLFEGGAQKNAGIAMAVGGGLLSGIGQGITSMFQQNNAEKMQDRLFQQQTSMFGMNVELQKWLANQKQQTSLLTCKSLLGGGVETTGQNSNNACISNHQLGSDPTNPGMSRTYPNPSLKSISPSGSTLGPSNANNSAGAASSIGSRVVMPRFTANSVTQTPRVTPSTQFSSQIAIQPTPTQME